MRVAWHLAHGLALVTFRFSGLALAPRQRLIGQWSARLLHILGVRLSVSGTWLPGEQPAMLVANHVSWLDIYVLNALCPSHFVAKSEIAHWPLLGPLARKSGTVFIERARKRDILRVNAALTELLREGARIAVFPEGTTSAGNTVLPFRPALLQAAVNCGAPVCPIALRYERIDGSLCAEAAFTGDTSFAAALWQVLKQPAIRVHLQVFPAAQGAPIAERKALARDAQRCVARALDWRAASSRERSHRSMALPPEEATDPAWHP